MLDVVESFIELTLESAVAHEYASQETASNASSKAQNTGPERTRNIDLQLHS